MSRARSSFRVRDVTAGIKAVRAAGVEVARIEISGDKVIIVPGDPTKAEPDEDINKQALERLEQIENERSRSPRKTRLP